MAADDVALLERIFEAVPGGVVHVTAQGAIARANKPAQQFLGLSFDSLGQRFTNDFDGATWHEDGTPCPVEEYPVTLCMVTGEPQGPTTIGVEQPGGGVRWATFRAIPVPGGGAVVTFVDITEHLAQQVEQQRLRRELELADRLASIGTLAASVAHEINNPLTTILGNLDLIERLMPASDPRLLRLLEAARRGSLRVSEIVTNLRVFGRTRNDLVAPFDLDLAIRSACTLVRPELRHRARIEVTGGPAGLAMGDRGRMVQVLLNLLINAAHAIELGNPAGNKVRLHSERGPERITLTITDSGAGMDEETLARIFDPFFTTKAEGQGSGLGLAIVQSILAELGGTLTIHSESGQGTTVTLTLAVAEAEELLSDVTSAPIELAPEGLHVLVVDDEPDVLETCSELLRQRHRVSAALGGAAAMQILTSVVPDVVLCDISMSPISGIELVRIATTLRPGLPFAFMVGTADRPETRNFLEATTYPWVHKPVNAEQLEAVLSQALRHARGAQR